MRQQRQEDRHEDDDDLRPFQRPSEKEDDNLGEDQEHNRRQVHAEHEFLDQAVAAQIREHRRERPRADEQPAYHRRRAHRKVDGFLEAVLVDAAPSHIADKGGEETDVERPPADLVVGEGLVEIEHRKHEQIHRAEPEPHKPRLSAEGVKGPQPSRVGLEDGQQRRAVAHESYGCRDREGDADADSGRHGKGALGRHRHVEPPGGEDSEQVIGQVKDDGRDAADADGVVPGVVFIDLAVAVDPFRSDVVGPDRADAVAGGEDDAAGGAHGGGLGRRRQTEQDGAQNRQDQERQREEGRQHHDHDVAAPCGVDVFLAGRGGDFRIERRTADDVDDVKARQHEPGQDGAGIQPHYRHGSRRRVDDQHDRRRDQDAQAAAGTDDAGRETGIVAGLQHRRERQQPHQRHHGADDA